MQFNLRFWIGLLGTAGFIVLFLWKVDFAETGRELRDANYAYLAPAILIYFCALGFRSIRWRYLLMHLKPISPVRLYPVVAIGYLANNVLPMRLGEPVRSYFLGEREGVSKASGLATVAVERVVDGLTLIFLAAIIWPFVPWTDALRDAGGDLKVLWVVVSIVIAIGFVLGFAILFLLAAFPGFGLKLTRLLERALPERLRPKVEELTLLLIEGLGALRSPYKLLVIGLLSLPVWLAEAFMYYVVAISFDLGVSFQVILLVTVISNLATAIPSTIGSIGPFEVAAKATLVGFGVGAEPAAAYSFFVHIIALWLPVNLLGLFFLGRENISIRQLAKSRDVMMASNNQADRDPLTKFGEGKDLARESKGK